MLDFLFGLFSHDLAIDLGTANTLVWVKGKGIVIREPSVVARRKKTKEIVAIGAEAKQMIGKTPAALEAFRPLKDGVIADFDATEAMLAHYIKIVHAAPSGMLPKIPKPKVIIGIPSGVTEVERRAVQDAALTAGARSAYLIEEPIAGAIGAGLPIDTSNGTMIVDIGGGTTEIAVMALGGIVLNRSIRVAGDKMDEAIINFMRLKHSLLIGSQTAERIKLEIGSAHPGGKKRELGTRNLERGERKIKNSEGEEIIEDGKRGFTVVRGRDLEDGLPKTVRLTEAEIREALSPVISQILSGIAEVVEETPPELIPDILERGMALTGGGALIRNMDMAIAEYTKLPVWVVEDPLTSVVRGCALLLDDPERLKKMQVRGGLKS